MVSEAELNKAKNIVKIKFERFWNNFVGEVDKAAQNYASDILSFDVDAGEKAIEVKTENGKSMQFIQVPYRANDNSKVVDICIQFGQKITPNEEDLEHLELKTSKVNLTYLDTTDGRRGEVVTIQQGLRFEFDRDPQKNHPVFHVHYDRRCLDSHVLTSEYELEPDSDDVPNPDYPRVPSAPMDVLSVIQLILHDHLPDELENDGWPTGVGDQLEGLPRFPISAFGPTPLGGKPMVSDWWYVHQSFDEDEEYYLRSIPESRIPRDYVSE